MKIDIIQKIEKNDLELNNWKISTDKNKYDLVKKDSDNIFNEYFFNNYLHPENNLKTIIKIINNTFLTKSLNRKYIETLRQLPNEAYKQFEKVPTSDAKQFMKYFYLQVQIKQSYYNELSNQDKIKIMCYFFIKFFNTNQISLLFEHFWPNIKICIKHIDKIQL